MLGVVLSDFVNILNNGYISVTEKCAASNMYKYFIGK